MDQSCRVTPAQVSRPSLLSPKTGALRAKIAVQKRGGPQKGAQPGKGSLPRKGFSREREFVRPLPAYSVDRVLIWGRIGSRPWGLWDLEVPASAIRGSQGGFVVISDRWIRVTISAHQSICAREMVAFGSPIACKLQRVKFRSAETPTWFFSADGYRRSPCPCPPPCTCHRR